DYPRRSSAQHGASEHRGTALPIADYRVALPDSERQYHIALGPGELAEYILLPGDPDRTERIATRFESVELRQRPREFAPGTGTYRGGGVRPQERGELRDAGRARARAGRACGLSGRRRLHRLRAAADGPLRDRRAEGPGGWRLQRYGAGGCV